MTTNDNSPTIDIIATETGIVAKAMVGEGDNRRLANVTIPLAKLDAEDRTRVEELIAQEVTDGS